MFICIALIALGALMLVFYLIEKCKNYSLKGVLLKSVVSLLFLATALVAAGLNPDHYLNVFIIGGLILGLLGDIWLDLKYVYPQDDKKYTYAGFIVFGVGHILYVAGMLIEFFNWTDWVYILIPLLGGLAFTALNLILEKPLKLQFKDLKLIVTIYAFLLALTPLTGLMLCIYTSFQVPSLIMLFIGGISFAVSDLVLSNTYFGEGHERPIDFILNYITYYGAQFLIAFSIFFL